MTTVVEWTAAARAEPCVRVGIVLPCDGMNRLALDLPDAGYDLSGGGAGDTRLTAAKVVFEVRDRAVVAWAGAKEAGVADAWTVRPRVEPRSGDTPAVRVAGIVAGRGFHWQTRTEQLLPGELTVRCVDGNLLLSVRMPVEQYLAGVITSEMSGDCPIEFLKTQAVVARSWALAAAERKHAQLGVDVCNDDCCQRYQGTAGITGGARSAVEQTCGLVLTTDGGRVVDANYSKSCGGIVEAPENVWGRPKPGMTALVDAPAWSRLRSFMPVTAENAVAYITQAKDALRDAYCSPASVCEADLPRYLGRVDCGEKFFRWTVTYELAALDQLLREKEVTPGNEGPLDDIVVTSRGASGRATRLDLVYAMPDRGRSTVTLRGELAIRQALHKQCLYSSAFSIRTERDADGRAERFHLYGAGWGHGAGLCQIGALGMAMAGHDHRAILEHYYPTARIERVYER